ncbi:MAG: TonB-dependent receptor [Paraglaciecola sp.]|uniref:TonB-dependent receptor plug domain-containing protein n=1 Tax=Paraglaciecola sp. TaxID=1920173 RepID=UPI0032988CD8
MRFLVCFFLLSMCFEVSSRLSVKQSSRYHFDIPSQPVGSALKTLARQVGAPVILSTNLIRNLSSSEIIGKFTLEQALEHILFSTPLVAKISKSGLITIYSEDDIARQYKQSSDANSIVNAEVKKLSSMRGEQTENITVVGSNVRGVGNISGTVLSFSQDDLIFWNELSVAEFLQQMPVNLSAGVGIAEATVSGQDFGPDRANISGGQGVNLRGLGALSTLVLVNGRRLPNSGLYGDYVDVSHIPLSIVERVDVLLDGASAIYGSDAVGGVVNIILKSATASRYSMLGGSIATEGGATERQISHIDNFTWQSGEIVFGAEYYTSTRVQMTQRDRYANGSNYEKYGGVNWQQHTVNVSPVTTILANGITGPSGVIMAFVPEGNNGVLTVDDLLYVDGLNASDYNIFTNIDMLPSVSRSNGYMSFQQDIGEQFQLTGNTMLNKRKAVYARGYPTLNKLNLYPTSPWYIQGLSDELLSNDGSISFGRVYTDQIEYSHTEVFHFSTSLQLDYKLDDAGFLQFTSSYARDKQRRKLDAFSDLYNNSVVGCALGEVSIDGCTDDILPLNPFNTEPLSNVQLNQLMGVEDLKFSSSVFQSSLLYNDVYDNWDLRYAIGLDYREEAIQGRLYTELLSVNPQYYSIKQTRRNVTSFFSESIFPIRSNVELQAAVRYENFQGTGKYGSLDPKLGIKWQLNDSIELSSSWGTSFHAPAMRYEDDSPQLTSGGNSAYILNASRYGPCNSELVTFNGIIGNPGEENEQCTMTLLVNSGGAGFGNLKPESAETFSLDIQFGESSEYGWGGSLKYFNIRIHDRIHRIQAGTLNDILLDFFDSGDTYADALIVNPDVSDVQAIMESDKFIGTTGLTGVADNAEDVTMIVDARQRNIGTFKEQGIDFSVSHKTAFSSVDWRSVLFGTYLLEYSTQVSPSQGFKSYRNRYIATGAPAAFKAQFVNEWTWENWRINLLVNFVGGYSCEVCYTTNKDNELMLSDTPIDIDSWLTFSLAVRRSVILSGIEYKLTFDIENIFNREAPFVDAGSGASDEMPEAYDFANHTSIGRTVGFNISTKW